MNQREALFETVGLINERLAHWTLNWTKIGALPQSLSPGHVNEMADKVRAEPEAFSEAKLGRWLGWVQAAGTAMGTLSLDEAKEINKKWAGK